MDADPLREVAHAPPAGRVFAWTQRPGLSDCAPSGRIRLDALARWLQDVAYADVEDAGVADRAVWVIRRARLHVMRFPRFGEDFGLVTYCSGLGRMWAERRTTIIRQSDGEVDVEAVALWVRLDPVSQRPTPLTEEEITTYGGGAIAQRRVSARLRHPGPPERARSDAWRFRATECDLAGHINNSAYWQPLEEELLAGPDPASLDVEIEYRAPAGPGETTVLSQGRGRWIVSPDGQVHASILLAAAPEG